MARKSDIRRETLIGLAEASGLTSVEELSVRLGVTASTIRRDLARLQDGGRLARTYGGAMAIVAHHETSLPQRAREATGAKRAIARWAARQIVSGETVLLDSGTTTGALARELRSASNLTVVTTGLTTLNQLADVGGGVHLECLGGTFRPASQGFVGPLAATPSVHGCHCSRSPCRSNSDTAQAAARGPGGHAPRRGSWSDGRVGSCRDASRSPRPCNGVRTVQKRAVLLQPPLVCHHRSFLAQTQRWACAHASEARSL